MLTSWWVDGEDLQEPTRKGGAVAIDGFEFQKAYALLRLTWLPTCRDGLVEVRYEGAQDIDLRYGNGRQQFVQAKNYRSGGLSLAVLYEVIAGFARDIISARHRHCSDDALPQFRLVSTSAPIEPGAFELYRKVFLPKHIPEIASLIKAPYRKGLDEAAVFKCVEDAFTRTSFEVVLSDHAIRDFCEQASWALAEFGVPVEHVPASLARIGTLLQPRVSLQLNDVVEVLEELPAGHPGHANAPCRMLPAQRHLIASPLLKAQFLRGAVQILWSAVANNLAIKRTEEPVIEQALAQITSQGGMLVIEGAGGAGKSTLARRVAWNMHRQGKFFVLDVPFPADVKEPEWAAIVRLCRLTARPLLLVVDDVWRHASFMERLDRNVRSNLCVLATSRPGERPASAPIRLATEYVPLGALGASEIASLVSLVGSTAMAQATAIDTSSRRLAELGHIFALSLVLQNGSLSEFAKGLLRPLRENSEQLDGFIDLCAAAKHDQTVPVSILLRRSSASVPFWTDAKYDGLTFLHSHSGSKNLRGAHALVAAEVLTVCEVEPVERALMLCKESAPGVAVERRFAIRLLTNCVSDSALLPQCRRLAGEMGELLHAFEDSASYSDLHHMADIYARLGETEQTTRSLALASNERINDALDVGLALTRANANTFGLVFDAILAFYERDPTVYGRRRFLLATRRWATPEQCAKAIDQTILWLQQHDFPAEEARVLFDIGAYVSDALAMRIAPLVNDYARASETPLETSLAAIRLLRRAKRSEYFMALEKRLMEELQSSSSWSSNEMRMARQLARLTERWSDQKAKRTLCEILLRMSDQANGRRLQTLLLQSALHLAAHDQADRLHQAVRILVSHHDTLETKNLQAFLKRRFDRYISHP